MNRRPVVGYFMTLLLAWLFTQSVWAQPLAPKTSADLVREARASITEVGAVSAAEAIELGAIVVDVREPGEYQAGHLLGAINIPRGVLEFRINGIERLKGLDDAERFRQPIYVYCRTGGRAALATARMQEMGFINVKSIRGGFLGWEAEALPVTTPPED